jgi:hypothetical protein
MVSSDYLGYHLDHKYEQTISGLAHLGYSIFDLEAGHVHDVECALKRRDCYEIIS